MSLAIKNGTIFFQGRFDHKDILIGDDGRIAKIGNSLSLEGANEPEQIIDATGLLVLPGLIDPHVHLREPGATQKEDFTTGGRAAIAGGFTTVMDMPNNTIPTTTKARYEEKKKLAKKALCDIIIHFGASADNFDEVKKTDPPSLKLYMGLTTGELVIRDKSAIEKHFALFPKERPIVVHAADNDPNEAKNLAATYDNTEFALTLAKKHSRRVHLAHASTGKEITMAKKNPNATVEVAPHYLFLSSKDAESLGATTYGKVYPPLRSEQQRIVLWKYLEQADCIATDHAPHTIEDKEKGAAGFPGLETSLSLMLDACDKGLTDKIWVAERMTERVADAFNLKDRGRLGVGSRGDITIVDPKLAWTVSGSELETKCKWSPFEGRELKGKTVTVVKGGEIIYLEGEFQK